MNAPVITTTDALKRGEHMTILVYGPSGAGKTYMSRTTPAPEHTLIIGAEGGELSLADVSIPITLVDSMDTLRGVLGWLKKGGHGYQWVILDSLSEIAEVCLASAKKENKDGRKAYGEMQDSMVPLVKFMRDLPLNVVMLAKQAQIQDEAGRLLMGPSFPGKRLASELPYYLDLVTPLVPRLTEEGEHSPYLLTRNNGQYLAKARGGRLDMYEPPDLAKLAAKITNKGEPK